MDKFLICWRKNVGKLLFFHVINNRPFVKGGEVVNKNVIFHKIYTIFTHIYPHTLPRNNLFNWLNILAHDRILGNLRVYFTHPVHYGGVVFST